MHARSGPTTLPLYMFRLNLFTSLPTLICPTAHNTRRTSWRFLFSLQVMISSTFVGIREVFAATPTLHICRYLARSRNDEFMISFLTLDHIMVPSDFAIRT
jgi:hypothetical protein